MFVVSQLSDCFVLHFMVLVLCSPSCSVLWTYIPSHLAGPLPGLHGGQGRVSLQQHQVQMLHQGNGMTMMLGQLLISAWWWHGSWDWGNGQPKEGQAAGAAEDVNMGADAASAGPPEEQLVLRAVEPDEVGELEVAEAEAKEKDKFWIGEVEVRTRSAGLTPFEIHQLKTSFDGNNQAIQVTKLLTHFGVARGGGKAARTLLKAICDERAFLRGQAWF